LVTGALPLHELRDLTGIDLEHEHVSTVGGYIIAALGRLPRKGECVTLPGYRVTVCESDGCHISQLRFQKLAEHPELATI
jgi:CBS domain containing-hemolysin-like protein